ncbi:iron-sulfur cluster assembly scaffold protein [Parerythrobacter lacustris]|uniref:Iron-sulfur cluster assembly scaffold protein n=1 Tax=Parerythrobacter lacustris TaxID=2969984 RepID=A0ABT1XTV2_9SPHN|nr:iron-sulfur cluster assembly scaffold protein [Parerythrobacter lacustris]MCR2833852.1 iron-sulfur cluster assembly scaffold protein [Parerythrobacter lacustris]
MPQAGSAARLYTPDLLALAIELADYPILPTLPRFGDARSRSCGSRVRLACSLRSDDTIERLGLEVTACAVGQAAAAIFAAEAADKSLTDMQRALVELELWLEGSALAPSWPQIDRLSPARAFPGRHGAILLPWKAAVEALSNPPAPR